MIVDLAHRDRGEIVLDESGREVDWPEGVPLPSGWRVRTPLHLKDSAGGSGVRIAMSVEEAWGQVPKGLYARAMTMKPEMMTGDPFRERQGLSELSAIMRELQAIGAGERAPWDAGPRAREAAPVLLSYLQGWRAGHVAASTARGAFNGAPSFPLDHAMDADPRAARERAYEAMCARLDTAWQRK